MSYFSKIVCPLYVQLIFSFYLFMYFFCAINIAQFKKRSVNMKKIGSGATIRKRNKNI